MAKEKTALRTVAEIGEMKLYKSGRTQSPLLIAITPIGVVFCNSEREAIERVIYWDFLRRATAEEVHEYKKEKVSTKFKRRTY